MDPTHLHRRIALLQSIPKSPKRLKCFKRNGTDFVARTLGKHAKKKRLEVELTQKTAGQRLGLTSFSILNWERGLKERCRGERGREPAADGVQPLALPESSRANANDRLSRASLGRVEGGDGIVEDRDGADVRPQSSVPHPLDDLAQLRTIALDNEVDRQTIVGPCFARPD